MKIEFERDRYQVHWAAHPEQAIEAYKWCMETFGEGWGGYDRCHIHRNDQADNVFSFHKLYHAQWFCLRYFDL